MTLDQIEAIISGMENGIKTDTIFTDLRDQKSRDDFERMYNELYANFQQLGTIALNVDAKFEDRINAIIKKLELEKVKIIKLEEIKALISAIEKGLNIIKTDLRAQKNHAAFEGMYNETHTHLQQLRTNALSVDAKVEDIERIDKIIEELDALATEKLRDFSELKMMENAVRFLPRSTEGEFSTHREIITKTLEKHLQKTLSTRSLTVANNIRDNLVTADVIRDIETSFKEKKGKLSRNRNQANDLQIEVNKLQSELDELEITEGHALKVEADALRASLAIRIKRLESLINDINNLIKQIEIVENIPKESDPDFIREQHQIINKIRVKDFDLERNKKSIEYDRKQLKELREKLPTSFQKNKGHKKSKAHAVEEQAPAAEKVKFQSAKPSTEAGNEVVIAVQSKAPMPSDSTQAVDSGETAKLEELKKLVEAFKVLKAEIPSDESLYAAIDASNIKDKEDCKEQRSDIFKTNREMIDRAIANIESVISGVNDKKGSVKELQEKIMDERYTGLLGRDFSQMFKSQQDYVHLCINKFKEFLKKEELNHVTAFLAINPGESLMSELQEADMPQDANATVIENSPASLASNAGESPMSELQEADMPRDANATAIKNSQEITGSAFKQVEPSTKAGNDVVDVVIEAHREAPKPLDNQGANAEKVKFQSAKKPSTKAGNEVVIAAHRKAPKPSDSTQAVDSGETARFKEELSKEEEMNHDGNATAIENSQEITGSTFKQVKPSTEAGNDVVIAAHRNAPKPLDTQGANAEKVKFKSAVKPSTEAGNEVVIGAHRKPSVSFNYSTHFSAMRHAAKIIAGFTLMLAGAALMAFSATHLNLVVFSIGMAAAYAGVVLIADGSIGAKSSFRDDDKPNDLCVSTSKP